MLRSTPANNKRIPIKVVSGRKDGITSALILITNRNIAELMINIIGYLVLRSIIHSSYLQYEVILNF